MTSELPDSTPEQPQDPSQPSDETKSEADYLDEIRQDLKDEANKEQTKKKSGWLARLTGRLQHEKKGQESAEAAEDEEKQPAAEQPVAEVTTAEQEQSADEETVVEPRTEPAAEVKAEEESPKALAFDIEVEEIEWSPPEEVEEEQIDDELFSNRLEQFATGDTDSPSIEVTPPAVPFEPDEPAEEAPSPFSSLEDPIVPFVIDDPVNSDIDFNAPLPTLDDQAEPHELDAESKLEPQPAEPVLFTHPFALDEEAAPAAFDDSESEGIESVVEPVEPFAEGEADDVSTQDPADDADAPGELEADSQSLPRKPGFFARIFPFRRANDEPDRYTMDDEVVTGRLNISSTTGEGRPEMPTPGKTAPAEEQPPKPAGTRPFWDGVSEDGEAEEDHPQTEEEFWESLARKERDKNSPFRSQQMNWAAYEEKKTPPAGHTTPFNSELDEDWPGEGPAAAGAESALSAGEEPEETGAESLWADDAIPTHSPSRTDTWSAFREEAPLDSEADSGIHGSMLPKPDPDEDTVEIGELRSIALEDYQEKPGKEEGSGKSRFTRWLIAHRVALIVSGLLVCSLVAISIIAWPMLMRGVAAQPTTVTATPDPAALPYPVGLRLTGGWFFNLQKGQLTDGAWDPSSGEWLEGTELRRVVALPWSRQSEAVIKTLLRGDEMLLHMSNNDVQTYAVRSVEQVDRTERDVLTGNDPSLLIVLVKPNSDMRWVVLCAPAASEE